jgi:uncharacterized protein DUF664
MLEAWLDFHRDTLALKCDGLTGGQLRQRAVPPAKLSLLGLVRHMAEGEQQWFKMVLGGEQVPWHYYTEDNPDADFDDVDSADVAEAFETWRSECAQARERAAGRGRSEARSGRVAGCCGRWHPGKPSRCAARCRLRDQASARARSRVPPCGTGRCAGGQFAVRNGAAATGSSVLTLAGRTRAETIM